MPPRVDAVIVAYNSARTLRACVEPLAAIDGVRLVVVDNCSPDDTAAPLAGLDAELVRAPRNGGFAAGCNLGIARGAAPYVLLLNPDARMSPDALHTLVAVLDANLGTAIAGPLIVEDNGTHAASQRRFPRPLSTFAQALFLHRLWPRATWTDELVRDPAAYRRPGTPDWVSGACMLIRREALEQVGGMDEDFFLYCEDMDVCARVRDAGWDVRFEPRAVVHHEGGASRPREELLAMLARNRVLYARKHAGRVAVLLEAAGVALGHATHAITSLARPALRRGHLRALAATINPLRSEEAR